MPISPLAIVDPNARLAAEVEVGPFSVVHANVEIGPGSRIGAHCEIGAGSAIPRAESLLSIGAGANIRSHSVVYAGSTYGSGLETGHGVTLREGTQCGDGVRIGTSSDVQGDCRIGDYVRVHSGVFVAKGSLIERCVWLMPRVVLTNDPTPPSAWHRGPIVEAFAVVCASAVLLPGVKVGRHAVIAAGACVGVDVPPHMLAVGVPARVVGRASRVRLRDGSMAQAYPWTRHFERGYPRELIDEWRRESAAMEDDEDVT